MTIATRIAILATATLLLFTGCRVYIAWRDKNKKNFPTILDGPGMVRAWHQCLSGVWSSEDTRYPNDTIYIYSDYYLRYLSSDDKGKSTTLFSGHYSVEESTLQIVPEDSHTSFGPFTHIAWNDWDSITAIKINNDNTKIEIRFKLHHPIYEVWNKND